MRATCCNPNSHASKMSKVCPVCDSKGIRDQRISTFFLVPGQELWLMRKHPNDIFGGFCCVVLSDMKAQRV